MSARSACRSLCYNFMPIFDWMRSDLAMRLPDGSTALAFDDGELARIDLSRGTRDLPGWAAAYDAAELRALVDAYQSVDRRAALGEPGLFPASASFPPPKAPTSTSRSTPTTRRGRIFGLPRIMTNGAALERLDEARRPPSQRRDVLHRVARRRSEQRSSGHHPASRWTARRGRRADPFHALPQRQAHRRAPLSRKPASVRVRQRRHAQVMRALREVGYTGPMRPDHGRMIWGETGPSGVRSLRSSARGDVPPGAVGGGQRFVGERAVGGVEIVNPKRGSRTGKRARPRA